MKSIRRTDRIQLRKFFSFGLYNETLSTAFIIPFEWQSQTKLRSLGQMIPIQFHGIHNTIDETE